MKFFRKYLLEN